MKENNIWDIMTVEECNERFNLLIAMNNDHSTIEDTKRYHYFMQAMRRKYGVH